MRFTKMQGLGNDFLLIYGQVPQDVSSLCRRLCDRHFGVGADGVIFVSPAWAADCRMRIFNADGSEARMCGNGIRCVGKYLYDRGLVRREGMTVETLSGVKTLRLTLNGDRVEMVSVDMGQAVLEQRDLPLPADMGTGTVISVGNPHVVVFTPDRARRAVPRRRQRRVRSGPVPRNAAHAGLGAGLRRHPGLRHRGLRLRLCGGAAGHLRPGQAH